MKVVKKPNKKIKRAKKVDVFALYGLKKPAYVRYTGLAGVLWFLTSQSVRQEEFKKYGGLCVDGCGRIVEDWRDADCGHFRSAKHLATRFRRENLGLQTKYCNSPNGGNGNQYTFGLAIDERYGVGTADRLTKMAKGQSKPFPKKWYDQEIKKLLKHGEPDV